MEPRLAAVEKEAARISGLLEGIGLIGRLPATATDKPEPAS